LIRTVQNPGGLMLKNTYQSLVKRGRINVVRRGGGEGFSSLIEFSSLPDKYKELVPVNEEDVRVAAERQKLLRRLKPDPSAAAFFGSYMIEYRDNIKGLPEGKKEMYINSASVLNAVREAWEEHASDRRKQGKRTSSAFWTNAARAVKSLPVAYRHSLPTHPRRLQEKLREYTREGYGCLVSGKYANSNTVKITPAAGEWLIAQYASQINRVTIEQLYRRYNRVASEKNWKCLKTSAAIRNYLFRPEIEPVWYASRYGELNYKNKYSRKNRTILPDRRDALWYSDGTKLNYYYRDELGNTKTCNVYEVMDVATEVLLGYHISDTEDFEAQYNAYKMAIRTAGYKPYEIRYDNQGGHKKLENSDFLKNIARHAIHTAPYNGNSKTIESAFNRFQSQVLHQDWFFTGQNITAKKMESHANLEFILANQKILPTLEEIKETYRLRREEWNNMPHYKTGIPHQQMYNESVNEGTIRVGIADMIDMFGLTTKNPSTYTSSGLEIQVKKKTYAYEVLMPDGEPDRDFNRRNVGRRFYTRYQPDDMDTVLFLEKAPDGDLRLIAIARHYLYAHRALQDQTKGDLHIIRQNEHRNKEERILMEQQRNAILEAHGLHPNQHGLKVAPLKGIGKKKKPVDIGEIQKELSNIAEAEEKNKQDRAAARLKKKQDEKDRADREEQQREFTRERMRLLELNIN
jgi:hypothetical protein